MRRGRSKKWHSDNQAAMKRIADRSGSFGISPAATASHVQGHAGDQCRASRHGVARLAAGDSCSLSCAIANVTRCPVRARDLPPPPGANLQAAGLQPGNPAAGAGPMGGLAPGRHSICLLNRKTRFGVAVGVYRDKSGVVPGTFPQSNPSAFFSALSRGLSMVCKKKALWKLDCSTGPYRIGLTHELPALCRDHLCT